MESDFYLLNNTSVKAPLADASDITFTAISSHDEQIHNKVVITSLNDENLIFLKHSKSQNLKNCVFLYLLENEHLDLNIWADTFSHFKPSSVIKSADLDSQELTKAIRFLREQEQTASLKKMVADDESSLISLKKDQLEKITDVEKRLLRNKKRIRNSHLNERLNLNCLESIFNAKTIGEIEDQITSILREPFRVDWVRILTSPSEILTELPTIKYQNQFETKVFDLDHDEKAKGKVVFASQKGKYIKESVVPLLQKISDALSLRLKQIETENEIQTSNAQWETTFKALPFKAALINKKYQILELGGQFNTKEFNEKKSTLCYEKFFDRVKPCDGCKLGENFLVDQKNDSLEVNSKEIFDPVNDEHYYLNFYRDFEVTTLGESGGATKIKLEELGIISGSIAHELNNPLGGIRILLELLKEDENMASANDSTDLDVLMSSTNKCIDIVSELLNFTRAKKSESVGDIKTLKDYFEQLKVFTQAYLLSEGVVLKIYDAPYLSQKTISADSSMSIKLLEAVAYLSGKLNNSSLGANKTIYLYGTLTENEELKITFSSLEPSKEDKQSLAQAPEETPLAITPTEGSFEEFTGENQEQTLTLKFSTEVKLNGTHV